MSIIIIHNDSCGGPIRYRYVKVYTPNINGSNFESKFHIWNSKA